MGNLAQRDEGPRARQLRHAVGQEGATGMDFGRHRLVLRRQAADRIDDDRVAQFQPVIDPRLIIALRQAELLERREKQLARDIAGEGPTRAVCALLARRQADDADPRHRVAKGGHRRVPPVGMARPAFRTQRDQAGAEWAVAGRFT